MADELVSLGWTLIGLLAILVMGWALILLGLSDRYPADGENDEMGGW